jgi:branched-chain amino acid transport system substrate-binding protein
MKAVFETKLDTLNGTIDFTAPVAEGSKRPVPNVSKTPLAGGQWRKGTKWPYELVIVGNVNAPMVAVEDKAQPLS